MQHHLERAEVGECGFDHGTAAGAFGGVCTGRERATVPVQHRRLQDTDGHLVRLAERDLEMLAGLFVQPAGPGPRPVADCWGQRCPGSSDRCGCSRPRHRVGLEREQVAGMETARQASLEWQIQNLPLPFEVVTALCQ